MRKVRCPVCRGAKTHVVQEEEKLCFLCTGDGEIVLNKIVKAMLLKLDTPSKR